MVSRFSFSDPDREVFRHASSIEIELLDSNDKMLISFCVKGVYDSTDSSESQDPDEAGGMALQERLVDPITFAQALLTQFSKARRPKSG